MLLDTLRKEASEGNGKSAYALALAYDPSSVRMPVWAREQLGVSDDKAVPLYREAYEILQTNAAAGDGEAMHLIAIYFQSGCPPVAQDFGKFILWTKKAFDAGYLFAANDLYSFHANRKGEGYDVDKAKYYLEVLKTHDLLVIEIQP
jgi:TPR repeat protein